MILVMISQNVIIAVFIFKPNISHNVADFHLDVVSFDD